MTGERPSPERTAELRRMLECGCLLDDGSWQPPCTKCAKQARATLDELVDALAAETARRKEADRNVDLLRGGYETALADVDALAARLEQAREALQLIAYEDSEGDYEPPLFADVLRVPACTFRAPVVASAALAALQEAPSNGEET